MNSYKDILRMIEHSCNAVFSLVAKAEKKKIIECATQIYIKQMELEHRKESIEND